MYLRRSIPYLFERCVHNGVYYPCTLFVKCDTRPRLLRSPVSSCVPECRRLYTPTQRVGIVKPLFLQAHRYADRVALIDENGVYRYKDIMSLVETLTDRISDQLGAVNDDTAGERVCVLCPNNASHVVAQLAAWMSGSIAVAVSPKYPAAQLEYFLTDSQCRMVIATDEIADKVQPVASKLGVSLLTLSATDYSGTAISEQPDNQPAAEGSVGDNVLQQKERHSNRLNRLLQLCDANKFKNKPAFIFYTSGTTGSPKVSTFIFGRVSRPGNRDLSSGDPLL